MKKFLFTLAALMMAGSLCAEDYMFIDDFEVSQELLQQTAPRNRRIDVPVKAHFDAYVSAWQVDLTLPEGVSSYSSAPGAGMTIPYMNKDVEDVMNIVTLNANDDIARYIAASTAAGFWFAPGMDPDNDDPVSYGAVKWLGDYECMFTVKLQFEQTFAGGDIIVKTAPSSGADTRGPITDGTVQTKVCHVTVEGGVTPTPEDFVGTASVVFNENVATISYTSNDPNAEVVVTVNGTETEVNWNRAAGTATWTAPINTTPGHYSYTVKLTVTPDGENFVGDAVSAQDTYEYDVLEKTATPVITIVEEHHNWVSFDVEGDGTVLVYVDGNLVEPAADGHYYVYASTEADVTYVVTATAQENGKLISDTATETIEIAKWDAVNELVNGKTIANVRYFNMAGQEMQSVNGMTIKVITYTDGTTSAVKVMK